MSNFDKLISSIKEGSVVSYKEYELDRHERKKEVLYIEDSIVQAVFPANKPLDRVTLETYYGKDISDMEAMSLSVVNCPRIVLGLGVNKYNELDIKVVTLNQDFFNLGLQELTVTNELNPVNLDEPNYLFFQGIL